jgi:hypothetical protein
MSNFAMLMTSLDRHMEAEAMYRETISVQKELLGERHPVSNPVFFTNTVLKCHH